MNFHDWSKKRKFVPTTLAPIDIKAQLGNAMTLASDVVIIYPFNTHIEVVDGSFEVICGNMDLSTSHLPEAEAFIWDNWIEPNNLHLNFEETVERLDREGDYEEIGALYATHMVWALGNENMAITVAVDSFNNTIEKQTP